MPPAEAARSAKTTDPQTSGSFPDAPLRGMDGADTSVHSVLSGKPTLVVIYRGGWCPYCNLHLGEVAAILDQLQSKGIQLIAISPDKPEALAKTHEDLNLQYDLFSDASMDLGRKLGLAFAVNFATRLMQKALGIDIGAQSGEDHNELPVPAAYLVDASGNITWNYTNPDFKSRAEAADILAAVDALQPA